MSHVVVSIVEHHQVAVAVVVPASETDRSTNESVDWVSSGALSIGSPLSSAVVVGRAAPDPSARKRRIPSSEAAAS